jgi:hypothetical protein
MSGLDEFQWSVQETGKKPPAPPNVIEDQRGVELGRSEPALRPPPNVLEDAGTTFKVEPPLSGYSGVIPPFMHKDGAGTSDGSSFGLIPPPAMPPGMAPPAMSQQLEQIIHKQVEEVVGKMAQKLLPEVAELLVPQGSVTVDGVSLTVNRIPTPGVLQVSIIEWTEHHTTLGRLQPADRVHLEADVIGKYVRSLTAPYQAP